MKGFLGFLEWSEGSWKATSEVNEYKQFYGKDTYAINQVAFILEEKHESEKVSIIGGKHSMLECC